MLRADIGQILCSSGGSRFLLAKVDKTQVDGTFIHIFVPIYDEQKADLWEQAGLYRKYMLTVAIVNFESLNTRRE